MQTSINQADTLFENAGDPILIIDSKSGDIISANKLTSKLLKYNQEELSGLNISSLREKSTRGKVLEDLKDINKDGFKLIKTYYCDNYGHEAGDRLLIEVAKRIKHCLREEDTLSRQGGDEFAILLNDIESASQYEVTMKSIHQALTLPYFINDVQHNITASSGVTLYPSDDGDIDTLLRHADHAMYQSKLSGKHRSHLYSPDSDQRIIQKNLQLEEIEKAHNKIHVIAHAM
ncbi:MAG: diguanylate cyclase (GGDEF)-like protein [Colwellia sp.]|jgi:diguanylate cyclase (GGDEF)-like protein